MRHLVILAALAIAACSTTQVHRNPGQGYAPSQTSQVAVYYSAPQRPYESLGIVSAKRYKPGWSDPTIADSIPQLREAAAQLGADGVIVLQSQVAQSRMVNVEAEAIRFTDKP